jgi:hypothetical protein
VLERDFFFRRLGDLKGVRVLEFGGDRTRGNGGNLGKGVKGRGRGGQNKACSLVAFGERGSVDGRGSVRGDSVHDGNIRFHGVTHALVVLEAVGAKGSSSSQ